jgi:hypothetical protein
MNAAENETAADSPAADPVVKVEELDEAGAEKAFAEGEPEAEEEASTDAPAAGEIPPWASIPPGVKMPPPGASVAFLRIKAAWTMNPAKGDRWCMCAAIGETEEKLAYSRSRGDQIRSIQELSKATIRVVDGFKADWSGVASKKGSVSEFWSAIGAKGRQMVRNYYVRTHTVSEEEALDFFAKDFVNVTVS